MDSFITCPACESSDITSSREDESIACLLGPAVRFTVILDVCAVCGQRGDFNLLSVKDRRAALEASEKLFIKSELDSLYSRGVTSGMLERALRLPRGTVASWETSSGPSLATAAALMRFIKVYPDLLEVAADDFSYYPDLSSPLGIEIQE